MEQLYQELGLENNADEETVKKAYRKAAMKHHPDKGGDPEKFKKISEAADILTNPMKRAEYENRRVPNSFGNHSYGNMFTDTIDPMDIFNSFFGAYSKSRTQPTHKQKGGSEGLKTIELSLEEIYKGKVVKLKINRKLCCQGCDGIGGIGTVICRQCNGQGSVLKVLNMGPSMVSKIATQCNKCYGNGRVISSMCEMCSGQGLIDDITIQSINIRQGIKNNETIRIQGEGNYNKQRMMYDDIVIKVIEKKHPYLERKGNDLLTIKEISIGEMICGKTHMHKHLDNELIKIRMESQIEPGKMYKVKGYGMQNGDLIITHKLRMHQLTEIEVSKIRHVLNVEPLGFHDFTTTAVKF
jgi:DnaJ family protein A protein 2